MTGPTLPVTIRPLERHDLDAVAAIEAVANPRPWSRQLFEGELALPTNSRHWLVAETAGAAGVTGVAGVTGAAGPARSDRPGVIGFGGIMLAADTAHLMNLGVDPAHTRAGIGERICLELVAEARRRDAIDLTLEVRASNQPAIALYEKLGMVAAGRRPGYYPDGEDAVVYWIRELSTP
jgi:ribosomal-protein-alanine N-acetyltransferase